jgi:hypothetical protein
MHFFSGRLCNLVTVCSGRGYLAQRHATCQHHTPRENSASNEIQSDLVEMQSRDPLPMCVFRTVSPVISRVDPSAQAGDLVFTKCIQFPLQEAAVGARGCQIYKPQARKSRDASSSRDA